jgi:hypothetical protein
MSAGHSLALAREHGIGIRRDGERLILEAPEEPPADVLAAIREAKPELLLLLGDKGKGDEGKAARYSRSRATADSMRERHPPAEEADELRFDARLPGRFPC